MPGKDFNLTRRQALGGFGAAGAGLLLGNGSLTGGEVEQAYGASCVLAAEQEEGPFYVDLNRVRSNIKAGRKGVPLDLRITVVNASTCKPIKNAAVDVWHADALGKYSDEPSNGTSGQTWLRGTQYTNAQGLARFRTVYPGFYQGRATHIHLKVHTGGHVSHVGQLFMPDGLSTKVYKLSPYTQDPNTRTLHGADSIYENQHGSSSVLSMTRLGSSLRQDGLRGRITVGMNPSAVK